MASWSTSTPRFRAFSRSRISLRIRGEIRTLTSQQRLTGYVIGAIPIGLLVVFMMISPEFTSLLFTDPLGRMMLMAAAVSEVLGFAVIQKIVNIEI